MQYGRLISFALGILGGGLLQIWVLLLMLNATGQTIQIKEILGNGGLFFFATTLCVGSILSLFDFRPIIVGNRDFNISVICCGVVILVAVTNYAAVLSDGGFTVTNPFSDNVATQIGCTLIAIVYWYYSGNRTGLFVKKDKDVI